MASSINNNDTSHAPPTRSYFHTTVTLQNWWLTKPQSNGKTLGVAGLTFQQNRVGRCFSSAPILKAHDFYELETVDGMYVILQGYINKDRTLESGFSTDVFDHFVIGFPHNWEEFSTICPKGGSAAECVSIAQNYGKDSIEGHADFNDNSPQHCDRYTVGMEAQDSGDMILSNKTSTVRKASSLETPRHIIKAGNDGLCEKSPMTREFDGSSLKMSPIIRNDVDSSSESKCLGVSGRRMTRSMAKKVSSKKSSPLAHDVSNVDKVTPIDPKKLKVRDILRMDTNDALSNKKAVNVVDYDRSESRKTNSTFSGGCGKGSNETPRCSEDMLLKMKSKRKQNDQNLDVTEDSNFASSVIDVNDDIVLPRTKMKTCQNKRKQKEGIFSSGVDDPNKGVDARNIIDSRKTIVTQSKSQSKPTSGRSRSEISKRQHISSKSTPRSSKGSKERYGSANILPLESFSGKKSRSGRVLLPTLEFWRNQKLVYDEDGQVCGVQEPM